MTEAAAKSSPRPRGGGSHTPRLDASNGLAPTDARNFAASRHSFDAIPASEVERIVAAALAEDLGTGDATTEATVEPEAVCTAEALFKERGVVCGLSVVRALFTALHARIDFQPLVHEGDVVDEGAVARISGLARVVLSGERTALNLLGRLSGIATLTRRFADAVEGTGTVILDTRKTTPGLRALEKYAVRCGGGQNHRLGLDDAILIKDNHLRLAGSIREAVEKSRMTDLPVEVECDTLDQVSEALAAGADRILLDNMTLDELGAAVRLVDRRTETEASGGATLESVREMAETGVDFISVGALTHSARSLDVSLEVR